MFDCSLVIHLIMAHNNAALAGIPPVVPGPLIAGGAPPAAAVAGPPDYSHLITNLDRNPRGRTQSAMVAMSHQLGLAGQLYLQDQFKFDPDGDDELLSVHVMDETGIPNVRNDNNQWGRGWFAVRYRTVDRHGVRQLRYKIVDAVGEPGPGRRNEGRKNFGSLNITWRRAYDSRLAW